MDKKKRQNFSTLEKDTLKRQVLSEKIIASKKTDGSTNEQKKLAWNRICEQFNATKHCSKRDVRQLQKLWNNIKFEYRKKIYEAKRESVTTDGLSQNSDVEMETVTVALGIKLEDTLDGDTVYMQKNLSPVKFNEDVRSEKGQFVSKTDTSNTSINNDSGMSQNDDNQIMEIVRPPAETSSVIPELYSTISNPPMKIDHFNSIQSESVPNEKDKMLLDDKLKKLLEEDVFEKEMSQKKERKKNKYTREDLLLHKKEKVDKITEMKVRTMEAKERASMAKAEAFLAKKKAFLAKEAYFKAMTTQIFEECK